MKHRFHHRLQVQPHHRLSDSIRHGRHPEHPDPVAARFRYLHRPHRRREIPPRGHPIPELVEIAFQVRFKLLDRFLVDTRRAPVGLDLPIRLPDDPLGNLKRLRPSGLGLLTDSSHRTGG